VAQRDQIQFAAERPVGKLSKWLRLMGFDTIYEQDVTPEEFNAAGGKRILLRRGLKKRRMWPSNRVLNIASNDPLKQVKEVISALKMTASDLRPFSMCTHCNIPVRKVNKDAIRSEVPDYIWETCNTFHSCANCKRIFWPGSHTRHSTRIIKQLLEP